jgi:uncharacterized protein DUF6448
MAVGKPFHWLACSGLMLALALVAPARALAHCDGLDGPVVKAAQAALDTRNPALVLIWVQPNDEPEVRAAFDRTVAVRTLGPEAKALADRFFFETVVRIHRAGEGAPFTGLQPAGRDLGPAIPAADKAIAERSVEPLVRLLTTTMESRLREHFTAAVRAAAFKPDDVAAGREYVEAYVEFMHFVERLYEAGMTDPAGHFAERAAGPHRR